ncbi:unnamed protein product [Schistosoma intercalatum]|nr:unnamed protein product [Schistosoma intercalatum]
MILSIAEKYWKIIIILSNLIFIVYSIVLISLGIDKLNFLNRFTIILHNAKPIIIPMIISSGLLCLITALIGLIGLIKQKQCIALIHIGGLLISAIIEFSTATMSAVSKDQFLMKVNSSLHESIIHYNMDFDIKNEFNNLQMTLGCCGASYFRDYLKIHSEPPSSCKPTSYGFLKYEIPRLLWPSRFQVRGCFVMQFDSFFNVCSIHFQRFFLISSSAGI